MAADYISCSVALNSRVLDLSRRQLDDFPSPGNELGNIEVKCMNHAFPCSECKLLPGQLLQAGSVVGAEVKQVAPIHCITL